jgi:hypothetical protein
MGGSATISAIKITAEIAHLESEGARGKLDSNVLVRAVVVDGAGWTCLRKDGVASPSAVWAAQSFCPLVALGHLPGTAHSWDQNRCTHVGQLSRPHLTLTGNGMRETRIYFVPKRLELKPRRFRV